MRKQYKGTKLKHVSKLVYKMKTHLHFNLINIHISGMKCIKDTEYGIKIKIFYNLHKLSLIVIVVTLEKNNFFTLNDI